MDCGLGCVCVFAAAMITPEEIVHSQPARRHFPRSKRPSMLSSRISIPRSSESNQECVTDVTVIVFTAEASLTLNAQSWFFRSVQLGGTPKKATDSSDLFGDAEMDEDVLPGSVRDHVVLAKQRPVRGAKELLNFGTVAALQVASVRAARAARTSVSGATGTGGRRGSIGAVVVTKVVSRRLSNKIAQVRTRRRSKSTATPSHSTLVNQSNVRRLSGTSAVLGSLVGQSRSSIPVASDTTGTQGSVAVASADTAAAITLDSDAVAVVSQATEHLREEMPVKTASMRGGNGTQMPPFKVVPFDAHDPHNRDSTFVVHPSANSSNSSNNVTSFGSPNPSSTGSVGTSVPAHMRWLAQVAEAGSSLSATHSSSMRSLRGQSKHSISIHSGTLSGKMPRSGRASPV